MTTISSSSSALSSSSKLPAETAAAIKPFPLMELSSELIAMILSKLPPVALSRTGQACKTLLPYSREDIVWKKLFQHAFPLTEIPPSLPESSFLRHFATHHHLVNAAIKFNWTQEQEPVSEKLLELERSNLPQAMFVDTIEFNRCKILDCDTDTWTPLNPEVLAEVQRLFPQESLSTFVMTKTHVILSLSNGYIIVFDRDTWAISSKMQSAGENPRMCISPTNPNTLFILTTVEGDDFGVQLDAYDMSSPDTIKHSKTMIQAEYGFLLGSGKHLVCLTWSKPTTETKHEVTITDLSSDKTLKVLLKDEVSPEQFCKFCMLTNGHLMIVDAGQMRYVDLNTTDVHEIPAPDGYTTTGYVDQIFGQTARGEVLFTGYVDLDEKNVKIQSWRLIDSKWTMMQRSAKGLEFCSSIMPIGKKLFLVAPSFPGLEVKALNFAAPAATTPSSSH